ncbi:MAG: DUF3107 domain-containing protein [Acidimicrobiales bacterium]|jgi:hypothetical protein
MHVRIGVLHTVKELDIEMASDTKAAALRDDLDAVLASGEGVLWLTDMRGRQVGVSVAKVAYVDIEGDASGAKIGFGA